MCAEPKTDLNFFVFKHFTSSIECDFSYIESDYNSLLADVTNNSLETTVRQPEISVPTKTQNFHCDEGFDPVP